MLKGTAIARVEGLIGAGASAAQARSCIDELASAGLLTEYGAGGLIIELDEGADVAGVLRELIVLLKYRMNLAVQGATRR